MKTFIFIFFFVHLFLFFHLHELNAQTFTWAKSISNSWGWGISVDANGNSYVTGEFGTTTTFDTIQLISSGSNDVFVAKYDSGGNCLWAKQAGGIINDIGYSISVDANGNSYVTGCFTGEAVFATIHLSGFGGYDIFIAKYDPNGNCLWAKQAGSSKNDYGYYISVDGNGNSFVTGDFAGTATFGTFQLVSYGQLDAFIAKYDNNGNCLWAKQAGGVHDDFGEGIRVDANGNSYVTGWFTGPAAFGAIQLSGFGNHWDIFVAKYDSGGNCLWTKQAGGPSGGGGTNISIDANGSSYVTGEFGTTAIFDTIQLISSGYNDVFVAKYDSGGNCLWAKKAGGINSDVAWSISVDKNGNSYLTGQFNGPASFGTFQLLGFGGSDIFVAKYDSSGNILWVIQLGGPDLDAGSAIATDTSGNSFTTGVYSGPAMFGTTQLSGFGAFITKISSFPVAVKNEINPITTVFSLKQNYPNPFNPSTSISFSIPTRHLVSLKVYNVLGKEIKTLCNEEKQEGQYTVNFNANQLSSGVYFYTLRAGTFIETKKLILIK
jgi:hypothetical protein